ncbi:hypothetical protein [Candidatus Hydrogenosomobacter endosymbioticus]|nr:hypothetical protein [Candidatus Hydrogenosomobacter endosymbioticus]
MNTYNILLVAIAVFAAKAEVSMAGPKKARDDSSIQKKIPQDQNILKGRKRSNSVDDSRYVEKKVKLVARKLPPEALEALFSGQPEKNNDAESFLAENPGFLQDLNSLEVEQAAIALGDSISEEAMNAIVNGTKAFSQMQQAAQQQDEDTVQQTQDEDTVQQKQDTEQLKMHSQTAEELHEEKIKFIARKLPPEALEALFSGQPEKSTNAEAFLAENPGFLQDLTPQGVEQAAIALGDSISEEAMNAILNGTKTFSQMQQAAQQQGESTVQQTQDESTDLQQQQDENTDLQPQGENADLQQKQDTEEPKMHSQTAEELHREKIKLAVEKLPPESLEALFSGQPEKSTNAEAFLEENPGFLDNLYKQDTIDAATYLYNSGEISKEAMSFIIKAAETPYKIASDEQQQDMDQEYPKMIADLADDTMLSEYARNSIKNHLSQRLQEIRRPYTESTEESLARIRDAAVSLSPSDIMDLFSGKEALSNEVKEFLEQHGGIQKFFYDMHPIDVIFAACNLYKEQAIDDEKLAASMDAVVQHFSQEEQAKQQSGQIPTEEQFIQMQDLEKSLALLDEQDTALIAQIGEFIKNITDNDVVNMLDNSRYIYEELAQRLPEEKQKYAEKLLQIVTGQTENGTINDTNKLGLEKIREEMLELISNNESSQQKSMEQKDNPNSDEEQNK